MEYGRGEMDPMVVVLVTWHLYFASHVGVRVWGELFNLNHQSVVVGP